MAAPIIPPPDKGVAKLKDLTLCFDEAKRNGSELPITEIIDGYYADIQAIGGNRYDTSSLLTRLYRKDLDADSSSSK